MTVCLDQVHIQLSYWTLLEKWRIVHVQSIENSVETIGANKTPVPRTSFRIEVRLFLFLLLVTKMELIKEVIAQTRRRMMTYPYDVNCTEQRTQFARQHREGTISTEAYEARPFVKETSGHIGQTLVIIARRMMKFNHKKKCQKTISNTDIKESEV